MNIELSAEDQYELSTILKRNKDKIDPFMDQCKRIADADSIDAIMEIEGSIRAWINKQEYGDETDTGHDRGRFHAVLTSIKVRVSMDILLHKRQ